MGMDIFSLFGNSENNTLIPARDPGAITGSAFIQENINLIGSAREYNILDQFLHGNIPDILRNMKPLTIYNGNNSITYLVISDVLSIGSNDDYIKIPMSAPTARKIADKYDCVLPTKKICDHIWQNAEIKLVPHPKGPPYDSSMSSTFNYNWHNSIINDQLNNFDKTKLITGHKKDVIFDKELITNKTKVGIYGWFNTNGVAIQGPQPNCTSHDISYADYSHGIRLVSQDILVNGTAARFYDVLNDPNLGYLISEQGSYDATNIYKY